MPPLRSELILAPLKALGSIQKSSFFRVIIPYIPFQGPGIEVEFLTRSTNIPDVTRGNKVVRTLLDEYCYPERSVNTHEWNIKMFFMEVDTMHRRLEVWYKLLDTVPLDSLKTFAIIELVSLNAVTPTKIAKINGIYPLKIPGVSSLSYEQATGLVFIDAKFSMDNVEYLV